MKALIPVAGAGTRLRPHTYTQPKPLIPVAGKPILAHIVDELLKADFREFVAFGDKLADFVAQITDDENKFAEIGFQQFINDMRQNRLPRHWNQGLGLRICMRAEARASPSDGN